MTNVSNQKSLTERDRLIREAAEKDLYTFVRLVHPNRILGHVHQELIQWWQSPHHKSHDLLLLPRDHQKSALLAYRVAWEITKNPSIRILYISATSTLAVKQLYFIKNILTSPIYKHYWPDMVNDDLSKREKWTETEISVDHPKRKEEYIRDPTIFTAGLTTTITGMHCDIACLDDVIVSDNAYSKEGRLKVSTQISYLASVAGTDSKIWAVGTRYHPQDYYDTMRNMVVEVFKDDGEIEYSYHLYDVFERQVEDRGDGTGQFLWPRSQTQKGEWFGFDRHELAKKKAQYSDIAQFRAQYYNDPNDPSEAIIQKDYFQYYNPEQLTHEFGIYSYRGNKLNVFASIDFAFSLSKDADYTSIVVVGVDRDHNYYVLDIDRFRSNQISTYFDRILKLHNKWQFRKLRAEVNQAQEVIVKDLRDNYIRPHGLNLFIDPYRPSPKEGTKEERINACLEPKYHNRQIFHYLGGNTQILEEELVMNKPPHDDVKDALASCLEICIAPSHGGSAQWKAKHKERMENAYHGRFGGVTL